MDADYAADYEQLYRHHWWWQARATFVLEIIQSMELPAGGHLLDIGCGGGWAFSEWSRFGQVHGVEIDPSLVARASEQQSRISCSPFDHNYQPDNRFSLIVMLDVLEHLEDPQAAIEHALELLEPDGKLLITVPAMPSLWTSHDDLNHHHVRYTRTSFAQLADVAGLQVERLDYFFHWTTAVKLLVRCKEAAIHSPPRSPTIPSPRMNGLFRNLCLAEQRLFSRLKLPFGTSLVCVGKPRFP